MLFQRTASAERGSNEQRHMRRGRKEERGVFPQAGRKVG